MWDSCFLFVCCSLQSAQTTRCLKRVCSGHSIPGWCILAAQQQLGVTCDSEQAKDSQAHSLPNVLRFRDSISGNPSSPKTAPKVITEAVARVVGKEDMLTSARTSACASPRSLPNTCHVRGGKLSQIPSWLQYATSPQAQRPHWSQNPKQTLLCLGVCRVVSRISNLSLVPTASGNPPSVTIVSVGVSLDPILDATIPMQGAF